MTRQQSDALAFIRQYLETHNQPPSMAEIMQACGLKSKSGAFRLVEALESLGFIRRLKYRPRSIEIIDPGEVKLNAEIFRLVQDYAKKEGQPPDVIVNAALRDWFGAAA